MNSNYSFTERTIANFLHKFPFIKRNIKLAYQYLNFLLFKKKEKILINDKYEIIGIQAFNDKEETFFGYYDKSPINKGRVLFHSTARYSTRKLPSKEKPIQIILKDLSSDTILYEDKTYTYNWQQGARLQWLDDNKFIYNYYDFEEKKYKSKIVDSSISYKEKEVGFPIYDCAENFGISLNFDRLDDLRPDYGYRLKDSRFFNYNDKEDGLFYVDFDKNTYRLLVSIEELKKMKEGKKIDKELSVHKINHIMLSPDNSKIMFLHRWFEKGVKYDRLYVVNTDGTGLKLLLDNGMVSHCFWENNSTIIGFVRGKNGIDNYYVIDMNSENDKILGEKVSAFGDGHPNVFENKVLFDTYPDRSRMKNLYVYNKVNNELEQIGSFYESFKFRGETRCDLHPRWSNDGKAMFIDSVHQNNKRKLYMIREKNKE